MKTIILAGGRGTRMGKETEDLPKPMITIGGIPMIQHIMTWYAKWGETDFIVLCGYKMEKITEYFKKEPPIGWKVALLDTGVDTPTGQRLLEAYGLLKNEHEFMLTYGDGIGNVCIPDIMKIHHGIGTITAVNPPARFGALQFDGTTNWVTNFSEKIKLTSEWINGGFMHFETEVFDYIEKDEMLEFDVLPRLAKEGQLQAYRHHGHWRCMDTPRDRDELEAEWKLKRCFWRR